MKPKDLFSFVVGEKHTITLVRLGDKVGFFCGDQSDFITIDEKDFPAEKKDEWKTILDMFCFKIKSGLFGEMPSDMDACQKYLEETTAFSAAYEAEIEKRLA